MNTNLQKQRQLNKTISPEKKKSNSLFYKKIKKSKKKINKS